MKDEFGGRRLDSPSDWVRIEISSAIQQEKHLIPILVNGARPLVEGDLPDDLKALAHLQVFRIAPESFNRDVQALSTAIARIFQSRSEERLLRAKREAVGREAEQQLLRAVQEAADREAEEQRPRAEQEAADGEAEEQRPRAEQEAADGEAEEQSLRVEQGVEDRDSGRQLLRAVQEAADSEVEEQCLRAEREVAAKKAKTAGALVAEIFKTDEVTLKEASGRMTAENLNAFMRFNNGFLQKIKFIYIIRVFFIKENYNSRIIIAILVICILPILFMNLKSTSKAPSSEATIQRRSSICSRYLEENKIEIYKINDKYNKDQIHINLKDFSIYTTLNYMFSDDYLTREAIASVTKFHKDLIDGSIIASPAIDIDTRDCK